VRQFLAVNRRTDHPLSCPLSKAWLPRGSMAGAAVDDPKRPIAAGLRCNTAPSAFNYPDL